MDKRRHRPASHQRKTTAKRVRQDADLQRENPQLIKQEKMKLWVSTVKECYPSLATQTYFVPPVVFNRVPFSTRNVCGVDVKVQEPMKQLSDVREGEAQQRVQHVLFQLLGEREETMVVVWRLDFDSYLNIPKDNSMFVRPRDLGVSYQRGRFDLLIISKKWGFILGEIRTLGDLLASSLVAREEELAVVRKKLRKIVAQLDKEEMVLCQLTKDLQVDLPVTKVLFLPNLRREVMTEAIAGDLQLQQDFSRCFRTDWMTALSRCIFSEQLPPVGKAWEVNDDVISNLQHYWWKHVTGTGEQPMSEHVYVSLVARFCGPSTLHQVQTSSEPRADINTLRDAVVLTARCMGDVILNAEQLAVLERKDPSLFITGPPGTGKSILLALKAVQWVKQGHHVHLPVLWQGSHLASHAIVRRAREMLNHDPALCSRLHVLTGNKADLSDVVDQLVTASQGGEDTRCLPCHQPVCAEARTGADQDRLRQADGNSDIPATMDIHGHRLCQQHSSSNSVHMHRYQHPGPRSPVCLNGWGHVHLDSASHTGRGHIHHDSASSTGRGHIHQDSASHTGRGHIHLDSASHTGRGHIHHDSASSTGRGHIHHDSASHTGRGHIHHDSASHTGWGQSVSSATVVSNGQDTAATPQPRSDMVTGHGGHDIPRHSIPRPGMVTGHGGHDIPRPDMVTGHGGHDIPRHSIPRPDMVIGHGGHDIPRPDMVTGHGGHDIPRHSIPRPDMVIGHGGHDIPRHSIPRPDMVTGHGGHNIPRSDIVTGHGGHSIPRAEGRRDAGNTLYCELSDYCTTNSKHGYENYAFSGSEFYSQQMDVLDTDGFCDTEPVPDGHLNDVTVMAHGARAIPTVIKRHPDIPGVQLNKTTRRYSSSQAETSPEDVRVTYYHPAQEGEGGDCGRSSVVPSPPGAVSRLKVSGSISTGFEKKNMSGSPTTTPHNREVKVVVDEAPWFLPLFLRLLHKAGVRVSVWAASSYRGTRPRPLKEVTLTRSARCPPVVVREVERSPAYCTRAMTRYTTLDVGVLSSMPPQTDGPPVKTIQHGKHGGLGGEDVWQCGQCGAEVARFLREELRIGKKNQVRQETLTFNDVLISGYVTLPCDVTPGSVSTDVSSMSLNRTDEDMEVLEAEERHVITPVRTVQGGSVASGFLKGLESEGVPFTVYRQTDAEALAMCADSDTNRVQVAEPQTAVGLERAVVVVVGASDVRHTFPRYVDPWLDVAACCTAQLVVVEGAVGVGLHDVLHRQLTLGDPGT